MQVKGALELIASTNGLEGAWDLAPDNTGLILKEAPKPNA